MKITGRSFLGKNVLNTVFSEPTKDCLNNPKPLYGKYTIVIKAEDSPIMRAIYGGKVPKLEPNETIKVFITGEGYGFLGTDTFGRDVWVGSSEEWENSPHSTGRGVHLGRVWPVPGTTSNLVSSFPIVLPTPRLRWSP